MAFIINARISIPDFELDFEFVRSSGPGGQNVNKVNSKAQLRWDALDSEALPPSVKERLIASFGGRLTKEGELLFSSDRYRDQQRNKEDCLEKLREILLSVAEAPKPRKKTKPTRGSQERRHKTKKIRGETKRGRQKGNWD